MARQVYYIVYNVISFNLNNLRHSGKGANVYAFGDLYLQYSGPTKEYYYITMRFYWLMY